jgi:hypothetical protein
MKVFTPLASIAFCNNFTTFSPTTSEQLNPFVQRSSIALDKPYCLHGKLKVNPNG